MTIKDQAISRRGFLTTSAMIAGATLALPQIAFAQAATNKRLLFVLQRGASDGLAAAAPVGDPAFAALRGAAMEEYADAQRLSGMFALHPSFQAVGKMAQAEEALIVHAVATSYRERSHFDAQNLLESGGASAYALRDGWLNRLVTMLPEGRKKALALSPSIPLALQGEATVSSYAPSALPEANEDLLARVGALYEPDPQLSGLFNQALQTRAMAGDSSMRNLRNAEQTGQLAARLMTGPDGARVMMVESDGWDSHAGQANQFRNAARRLDSMLGAFKTGMGPEWQDTLVLVATEFGRTAAMNGSAGTDHGTGAAMMLLGGTVFGGRVMADWPGLAQSNLYQSRDLRPTQSTEAVLASAVAAHFGLDPQLALSRLFPGRAARPVDGLLRV